MKESIIAAVVVVVLIILAIAISKFATWIIDLKGYRELWEMHQEETVKKRKADRLAWDIEREVDKAIATHNRIAHESIIELFRTQNEKLKVISERLYGVEFDLKFNVVRRDETCEGEKNAD